MKPIKVSMLIHDYYPRLGGAQGQLKKLVPLLSVNNIEVSVLTRHVPDCPAYEIIDDIPVYRMPGGSNKISRSLSYTFNSVRRLQAIQPDLIHAYELFSPTTTAVIAQALINTPVVVKVLRGGSLGDIQRMRQKFLGEWRMSVFKNRVNRFISISQEITDELKTLGVPDKRMVFIPNGVDTSYFKPLSPQEKHEQRQKLSLPDGILFIFTGRLAPEKGLQLLLSVWNTLQQDNAHLLIVGTGSEEATLRQLANDNVHFFGQVDDVLPYLQSSDVFVLPSEAEGLSNAMLEAMATGLATVATRVGGAPDLITSPDSGWLINVGDSADLKQALEEVLAQTDQLGFIGLNGRRMIEANYSLQQTAFRLCELYQSFSKHHLT